jgi:preprotein translocase subunit SecE
MNKLTVFIKDSYKELVEKVTWPNWEQLQQSTLIVLGASAIVTAVVGIMDMTASGTLGFIYKFFKKG